MSAQLASTTPPWTLSTSDDGAASQQSRSAHAGASSKADTWHAVLQATDDVDQASARARAAGASAKVLEQQRGEIRARVERLRSELSSLDGCEYIVLVLVLYFDERIMRRLPDSSRHLWRPLQRDWIGAANGGTEFYRILDHVLQETRTDTLVLEVFYYCLSNGFVGRYVDNPDALDSYTEYLCSRIAPEHREGEPESGPRSSATLPRQRRPAWYFAATGVLIVVMAVVATALSNAL